MKQLRKITSTVYPPVDKRVYFGMKIELRFSFLNLGTFHFAVPALDGPHNSYEWCAYLEEQLMMAAHEALWKELVSLDIPSSCTLRVAFQAIVEHAMRSYMNDLENVLDDWLIEVGFPFKLSYKPMHSHDHSQ